MDNKDIAQLAVSGISPFVAVGGALFLAMIHGRERFACVISYGMAHGADGSPEEAAFLSVHNNGTQNLAISRIRYLSDFPRRSGRSGTALEYTDPYELNFPYLIQPGELRRFHLAEWQALRLAEGISAFGGMWAAAIRRPRIVVEVTTTTGFRKRIGAEAVLNWDDRAKWERNK